MKYRATWPWEQPPQIVNCDGYSFAWVTNDGSFKSLRPRPSIRMVSPWSDGRQHRQNGGLPGTIESASRFDDASTITAKTKIYCNLMALSYQTISLVCMSTLIFSTLVAAIATVHSHCEVHRSLRTTTMSATSRLVRRLMCRKIALFYHNFCIDGAPTSTVASNIQMFTAVKQIDHSAPFLLDSKQCYAGRERRRERCC